MVDERSLRQIAEQVEVTALDVTFRAADDEGSMGRYDALFSFVDPETGATCVLYTDSGDEDDDMVIYASLCPDPEQLARAQAAADAGSTPKKPPVIVLKPLEGQRYWDLVDAVLDLLEDEDED